MSRPAALQALWLEMLVLARLRPLDKAQSKHMKSLHDTFNNTYKRATCAEQGEYHGRIAAEMGNPT